MRLSPTSRLPGLAQGQDIIKDKKFCHDFFRLLDARIDSLVTTMWKCKTLPPPSRKNETVIKYADVKWLAKID